ncbi:MAG: hypothetical protein ACLTZU_05930 [Odoribacter splanchnicus]
MALSQLFMVTESVTAGAFNGTGHTTPPALTRIIFTGARIPMAYFLTSFPQLGLTGIWWSITISSILKGSCSSTLVSAFSTQAKIISDYCLSN